MAATSILHRGDSFRFKLTLQDDQGGILNWDDLPDVEIRIYPKNNPRTTLKKFVKADLDIPVPSAGIAYAFISGPETEKADLTMYVMEYKYKYIDEEKSRKGLLGTFVEMKLEREHF